MERVLISGVIGLLRFTMTSGSENQDAELLGYARELHRQLETQIRDLVTETLGAEFEVLSVESNKGSISIAILIGAVGTFFMGFSQYESFIKSINLLLSQIKGLLQRFFGRTASRLDRLPFSVTASWQPGPALTAANQVLSAPSGFDSSKLVLGYLVLSHAVLLTVLLWLAVRHLK